MCFSIFSWTCKTTELLFQFCLSSSEIPKSLKIDPLLLRIERYQLRWLGYGSRIPQKRLSKKALLAKANGKRPVERSSNRLGLHPSELKEVTEDRKVRRLNLELLARNPHEKTTASSNFAQNRQAF